MLVSIGINLLLSGLNAFELCTVLWIHFSLVIFYMFLYVHLARSVSVTLVSWLYRSGDQGLKVETLVQRYSASSRFEDRIQVMHDGGLLHLTQNTATLTPKGRLLALVSELLGRALGEGLKG